MDIVEAILRLNMASGDAAQPTDLQIGTVVKTPPEDALEITVSTAMAPLRQEVLYLAEPVIEKKIPLLKHRHKFQHTHTGVHGPTKDPLPEPYTEYSLLSDGSDSTVQDADIRGWENGKVLELSKDGKYIILNPALKAGDKVLLLRVQSGQKFIVLSRVYEGGG